MSNKQETWFDRLPMNAQIAIAATAAVIAFIVILAVSELIV